MKRSEFMARLDELFGDEDVEIYLDTPDVFTDHFKIYIDRDGDAVIQPS